MRGPIAVVGASGNVGGATAVALHDAGMEVRALDPHPERLAGISVRRIGGEQMSLGDVPSARLDLRDPITSAPALDGARGLFLVRPPAISRVGPTLNALVDTAARIGVEHVVFSSVAGADENPIVPHHRVERHLPGAHPSWTVLRPGFFAQNLATAYRDDISADDRLYLPAGEGRVAFVDVRDLGELAARVFADPMVHTGAGYHLTGPEALTLEEVAALLGEVTGREIRYQPASVVGYLRHLRRRGLPLPQVVLQTLLHVGLRRGDAAEVSDDLPRLLGRPATPLRRFCLDHAELWDAPRAAARTPNPG